MRGHEEIPVSLMLDGAGDVQSGGAVEELSRRPRRVLWLSVRDGRKVVYKGLTEPLRTHPEEIAALRKEYLLSLRIDSSGVVGVYGFEEHPLLGPVIVMEFVDGVTLGSYLFDSESFPPLSRRRDIARGIARALADAHVAGIAHRDLKPDNILIRKKDLTPRVIDFGNGDSEDFMIYKNSLGTNSYGAPEQMAPSAAGVAADVYSFGKILDDLLPERRFSRLRSACKSADPAARPDMEQIVDRLDRSGKPGWVVAAAVAAAVVVTLAIIIGLGYNAGDRHDEGATVAVDTIVSEAPVVAAQAQPAAAPPVEQSERKADRKEIPATPPVATVEAVDPAEAIIQKYIKKADKINARYGAITYDLELKAVNDRRRMQRGADHRVLAEGLDRELQQAGVDAGRRDRAVTGLWTHIVFQTNKIDGCDEARLKIMHDYGISPAGSE